MLACRGVRGAITVEKNTRDSILGATHELLTKIITANDIRQCDVASAIFTTTRDLTAEYPAIAARALGWKEVPLLCGHEMDVPDGLEKCARILIHWNTDKTAEEIVHVYLKGARSLRPDLADAQAMMSTRQIDQIHE